MVRHKSQDAVSNSEAIDFLRTLPGEDAFGSVTGEKRDFLRRLYEPLHDIFKVCRNGSQANLNHVKTIRKLKIPQIFLDRFPKFVQEPLDFWERQVQDLPHYSKKSGLERTTVFLQAAIKLSNNIDEQIILRRFVATSAYELFKRATSCSSRTTPDNIHKFLSAAGVPIPVEPDAKKKVLEEYGSIISRGKRQEKICKCIANRGDNISNEIYGPLFYKSIPDNIWEDKRSLTGEDFDEAIRHLQNVKATETANQLGASHAAKSLLDFHIDLIGSQSIVKKLKELRHNKRTNSASHRRSKRPRTQTEARDKEQVSCPLDSQQSQGHNQHLTNTATIPPVLDDTSCNVSSARSNQSSNAALPTDLTEYNDRQSVAQSPCPDGSERSQHVQLDTARMTFATPGTSRPTPAGYQTSHQRPDSIGLESAAYTHDDQSSGPENAQPAFLQDSRLTQGWRDSHAQHSIPDPMVPYAGSNPGISSPGVLPVPTPLTPESQLSTEHRRRNSNISESGHDESSEPSSPANDLPEYEDTTEHRRLECVQDRHQQCPRPQLTTYPLQTNISQYSLEASSLNHRELPNSTPNFAQGSEVQNYRGDHLSSSGFPAMNLSKFSHTTVIQPQTTNLPGNGHTLEVEQRPAIDEQVAYALATLSRGAQANDRVSIRDHNGDDNPPGNHAYQGMPIDTSHLDDARLHTFNGNPSNQMQAAAPVTERLGQPHPDPSNYMSASDQSHSHNPPIHVQVALGVQVPFQESYKSRDMQTAVGGTRTENEQHHQTHQPQIISSNAPIQDYLETPVPHAPDQSSTNIRVANQRAQRIPANYDNAAGFDDVFCLPAQPIPDYDNATGFEDYLPAQPIPDYGNAAGFECQPIHDETMESANLLFHGTEEISVWS